MKRKRMIAIAAAVIVLLSVGATLALYVVAQKPYVYPMKPDNAEWKELTREEKHEVCRIPQYRLWFMSTEHLLDATLDHPLVITLDIFDKRAYGIEYMRDVCDAYCMLIKRSDAKDVMLARYWELVQDDDNIAHVIDSYLLSDLLLYDPILVKQLTVEEKEALRTYTTDSTEGHSYDKEWRESILTY